MNEARVVPELWPGMLDLYSAPGVAEACIEAQDACDADVLLLLTAALLARDGLQLTPDIADSLIGGTLGWREEVVAPLRALRRRWRGYPAAGSLRQRVKALELDAERSEVGILQSLLDASPPLARSGPGTDLLAANCDALRYDPRAASACGDALAAFRGSVAAFLWREPPG